MVKKSLKRMVALVAVVLLVMSMAACATKLNGTYTNDAGLVKQSFTFEEDNVVKMTAFGVNVEGEYEIKDGKITITYDVLGLNYDIVKDFEKKGKSIFIDGTEFIKE